LRLDPKHADANVGLGIYRYGNTRLGGLSNWIMQFGQDNRLLGLNLIERALKSKIVSRPLAIKTLIWFYISEQINPENRDLPPEAPLSPRNCRIRALALLGQYETQYFQNVEVADFKGNKGLSMMRAIQFVLDGDYASAQHHFVQENIRHAGPFRPGGTDPDRICRRNCRCRISASTANRPTGGDSGGLRNSR